MGVQFDITGDNTGFLRKLEECITAAKNAADNINSAFSKVSEVFEGVTKAVTLFTTAIAGGELFEKAIEATRHLESEALSLGKSLGISASQASFYVTAIDEVGGTGDDVAQAVQGLTRQLRTHESAINDMGIATRDSSGHYREMNDILTDAIEVVNSYAAGTDRNLAATTAFGKGMSATSPILKLSAERMKEARQDALELGLVVGKQNVEDYAAYKRASAESSDVLEGFKKAIGDELIPVLTQFGEWFRDIGPGAIEVLRTAMADLVTVFWGLYAVVGAVWDILRAMLISVIGPLTALGSALWDVLHGKVDAAKQELAEIGPTLKEAWSDTFDSIAERAQKAFEKVKQAFTDPTDDAAAAPKGRQFTSEKDLNELRRIEEQRAQTVKETALGEAAVREEALKQQLKDHQVSSAEFLRLENDLLEQRLRINIDFYRRKLELDRGNALETAKTQTEIAKTEAEFLKERQRAANEAAQAHVAELTEQRRIEEQRADAIKEGTLGEIATREEALKQELKDHQVAAVQFLRQELDLISQRLQANLEFYRKKLELAQGDAVAQAKIQTDIAKSEAEAQKLRQKAVNEATQAQLTQWRQFSATIKSSLTSSLTGMLEGTTTFAQAVANLFRSLINQIIGLFVQMAIDWAEKMLLQKVLGAAAATSQISSNAGMAATAAMASVAAIPIIGWAMAPGVGAATFAEAMAYNASVAAERGFDVPAGVSPVTQLHPREMVLPEEQADVIRGLAGRGGASGDSFGDTHITNHFHQTVPTTEQILKHLGAAVRNGHPAARRLRGR